MSDPSGDRQRLLAERAAEIEQLREQRLTDVTPSRRDFTLFIGTERKSIGLIPRLRRSEIDAGGPHGASDLASLARLCDEADVPAIAVATAAVAGGSIGDLLTVSEVVSAPLLQDDLCLHPDQLYRARLHGADAVILPLSELDAEQLDTLVRLARSLHMSPILEMTGARDGGAVAARPRVCVGVRVPHAGGLGALTTIINAVPAQHSVLLLDALPDLDALRALRGLIDAAVVDKGVLDRADPLAVIRAWQDEA